MRVGLTLEKNYCYELQAVNTGGRILVHVFQNLDPTIAVSTLASMVKGARCKYASKPMRFGDFFPLYGMGPMRKDGTADLRFGYRLERFEPNIPIYFP